MKDAYIRMRMTEQEKLLLKKRAEEFSMTISDYIRYCCLVNPPKKLEPENKK